MSETHSEQRKLGKVVESSANKKARREVSKKYGKFTEDCIPDGVFPIGDDVFVFASIYYDSVSVHIRRFKKYGKTYYPTPEGITLDPQWIEYIMRKKKVPESLEELPSGLFPPERHIQITSENFTNFTFKRIKYGPNKEPTFKEISISREQWAEMIEKYGAIENAVIDNVFLCMDFLTAYKTFCEGPIENALPFSLDVSLGQRYLTQILKKSICSLLNEKGLNQPQKLAEDVLFKMDAANQALLERAKRARSVSRSLVTKQINKLENEINNSADKTTVHEIYVQLISKYEEMSTLDKEVESLINIESLEDEILTREEYRDKFIIWKIRAERYIGTVSSITFQNSVENQPQNVTPLNNTVSSVLTNQPRLPKLTLESFSGKDISSFPSFWARFKSAVDDNSNLNDVDKFSYLKSVVTSDAELAIRGLTLTPENYAKAVKILEDRFGRKELIVDYHMNRLLNLSPVRKSFDVIALRKLYDQLEINIRGLESLEIFPDSYSCLLFPIIMKAIPPDLALEYNRKHNEKQSQVTDLTTYLRGEVESRERTEILLKPHGSHSYPNKYSERAPPISPQPNRKGQGHSRFYPSHKSGVRASANELLSAAVSNCLFCSEDTHASDMCENLCVQEKRAKLIKEGRCFLCCYTCCHVKKCKKEVCSYCKGRHARAICFKLENSLKQNSHIDLEKGKVDVKPTSSNSVLHNRGGVLLQCVKAEVIGHISSDKIFCLFDNGSEKSFIKKNVSRRLGLKKVGSERLNIFSFGCKTPKKQTCSKVEVRLRNILNGEVTVIEALEIEEISKATLSLPSPDVWTEMETKGFRLTFNCSESSENCEISLLIGSDFIGL
ncbi:DUF1758 domain-containing protein [Trichonephila clavata]|uniref:DUF1758 domain-containing protein n=8 Tax=Trichonephila clavata TaxID=2740835 RepID=A0A8X6F7R3_TRICU|nr:DUF1758 domain-containing protein [Trichonephila clavata]